MAHYLLKHEAVGVSTRALGVVHNERRRRRDPRMSRTSSINPGIVALSLLGVCGVMLTAQTPPVPPTNVRVVAAYPTASTTGVPPGVELTPSGSITISTAGAVVSGLDISGTVNINANDVTLKNSRIRSNAFYVVRVQAGRSGVVIQDSEIDGVGTDNAGNHGIAGGPATVRRCNIHHVENGITPQSGGWLIEDNYIHTLLASGSPHYDGIQIDGGISNITIRHNTVINQHNQTAAVMIDNYFGPISNIVVDNNRLVGGGYTVYSDGQFSGGTISGVSFTNNRLGRGYWGYASIVRNTPVWTGNLDDVTGAPVSR
jgi:hypothetical protein